MNKIINNFLTVNKILNKKEFKRDLKANIFLFLILNPKSNFILNNRIKVIYSHLYCFFGKL